MRDQPVPSQRLKPYAKMIFEEFKDWLQSSGKAVDNLVSQITEFMEHPKGRHQLDTWYEQQPLLLKNSLIRFLADNGFDGMYAVEKTPDHSRQAIMQDPVYILFNPRAAVKDYSSQEVNY